MLTSKKKRKMIGKFTSQLRSQLICDFQNICTAYVVLFCQRHQFDIEDCYWAADKVGEVLCVSDYYFQFNDIRTDVDKNADPDLLMEWYELSLKSHEDEKPCPTYESYIKLISNP